VLGRLSHLRLAGVALIAAAALGLVALAAGLLLTNSRQAKSDQEGSPSTDEALTALIDGLVNDDAAALAGRFAGVAAREGYFDFVVYESRDVPAAEWTARLAATPRRLYAVVRDPPEGHRQPGPGGVPLLMTPRDYDIVLVADEPEGIDTAWRFSVLDGAVIDIFVTPVGGAGPGGQRPHFGLRGLMPNPVSAPSSFLVLPPEDAWPAPTPYAGSGISGPDPAPVDAPTFAPDGRTGDRTLDAIIASLVEDDAAELSRRFAGLAARERVMYTGGEERRVPLIEWAGRLAAAQRSLYAVFTDEAVGARIALAVDAGGAAAENWQFGVDGGRLVEVEIHLLPPYAAAQAAGDRLYYLAHYPPMPAGPPGNYDRFYVLPPEDRLPQPPAARALTTRTGDPGVDRLLDLIQAGDAARLRAAIESTDWPPARYCGNNEKMDEMSYPAFLDEWAADVAGSDLRLHAVARVPQGYPIPGQHVIILVREVNPLWWEATGIFERDGKIVAILTRCATPESLYPPRRFLLAPPPPGQALDPSRRPTLPGAEGVLDAIFDGNSAVLHGLIDFPNVPCGVPYGIGYALACPSGAPIGTPVEGLVTGPHGEYSPPGEAAGIVIAQVSEGALYAIVESRENPGAVAVIFARFQDVRSAGQPPRPFTYGVAGLVIRDGRLIDYQRSGPGATDVIGWLARHAQPDFLLPPP
jgi:hypothetical protein